MGNGIAAGIRIHSSFLAACPSQRVRENPLLWTLGPHRENPFGGCALFAGRFKDVVGCHTSTPKKPCLSLLRIITSMGQTAGRNHTYTTLEKKMCLKTALCLGFFQSKKPRGKLCAFQSNLRKIGKKSVSSAAIQNVKE